MSKNKHMPEHKRLVAACALPKKKAEKKKKKKMDKSLSGGLFFFWMEFMEGRVASSKLNLY